MKLIVAHDLNKAIGHNNTLPWHLSEDLKQFKSITLNSTILMGRKTYESIGRPLPNRKNLILSSNKNLKIEGCQIVNSIQEAIELDPNLFVIGGGQLYDITLPLCSELYLTVVKTRIKQADVFFPNTDMHDWITISSRSCEKNQKNDFDFTMYHLRKM